MTEPLLDPIADRPKIIKIFCEGGVFLIDESFERFQEVEWIKLMRDFEIELNKASPALSFSKTVCISFLIGSILSAALMELVFQSDILISGFVAFLSIFLTFTALSYGVINHWESWIMIIVH